MTSTNELILSDKGLGFPACSEALQAFVTENKQRPTSLLLNKNAAIGVEGIVNFAETWLAETTENNNIETLNIASCSVGRCVNPATGANLLTDKALISLGTHGNRLKHLDLSWNDLNEESIRSFVWALLDIKGPQFDAEEYDPSTLRASRGCALESLNLKGNSICDEGLEWIARLLEHPDSKLHTLNLTQCAIQDNSGELLSRILSSNSSKLISLDVRENEFKSWSRPLAEASINNVSLNEFCGIKFGDISNNISKAFNGENILLTIGKDVMCHGTLALLLSIRPFIVPDQSNKNPLAHKTGLSITSTKASTFGTITLDFKNTQMCGFYWEDVEAVDELIEQLTLSSNINVSTSNNKSPEIASGAAEIGQVESDKKLMIQLIEFNTESGLTDKQVRAVYDACGPDDQRKTTVKMNGNEIKAQFSCIIS